MNTISTIGRVLVLVVLALPGVTGPVQAQSAGVGAPDTDLDLSAELQRGDHAPTLREIIAMAITRAPRARIAAARTAGAQARHDESTASFYPRLDLQGGYTRYSDVKVSQIPSDPQVLHDIAVQRGAGLYDPQLARQGALSFPQFPDLYAARAQVSYSPTDLFLVSMPTVRATERMGAAARWTGDAEKRAIAFAAYQAFYEYIRARARRIVASASLRSAQRNHVGAELQVQAGTLGSGEQLAAELREGQAQVELALAESSEAAAHVALERVAQQRLPRDLAVSEDLITPIDRIERTHQGALAKAVAERPELKSLREAVAAHALEADSRAGTRWPRLSLVAGADLQNPKPRNFPYEEQFGVAWDVSALVEWSPNVLFEADARVDSARAAAAEARAQLDEVGAAIREEVARAELELRGQLRALQLAEQNIRVAQASREVQHALFGAGRARLRDLMDAEDDLQTARFDFINAAVNTRIAWARLRYARGEPLQW